MKIRFAAVTALATLAGAALAANTAEENRRFVGQVLKDLLDRPANSAELATLTELAGSSGRAFAVRYVQTSLERYNRVLQDFHRAYLRRDPAPGETTQWMNLLRKNNSVEPIIAGILASGECYSRQGSPSSWVQMLYKSLLGRSASSAELKIPPASVASASARSQFVGKILSSSEARSSQIQELYLDLLGRRANPAEIGHWLAMMAKGTGEEAVRTVILSSDEYFGLAQLGRRR